MKAYVKAFMDCSMMSDQPSSITTRNTVSIATPTWSYDVYPYSGLVPVSTHAMPSPHAYPNPHTVSRSTSPGWPLGMVVAAAQPMLVLLWLASRVPAAVAQSSTDAVVGAVAQEAGTQWWRKRPRKRWSPMRL